MKKIMILGSGELGKEVVISLKRYGHYVVAVDSYENAPAMEVADNFEVINMLDGEALQHIVDKHQPHIIVPEVEAIRTEKFYEFEKSGIQVVPSSKAANYTMNRKLIRDLASKTLGLKTARYEYATNLKEFHRAIERIGLPCVVKPLMSSSGKGQSVLKIKSDIEQVWDYAMSAKRGDLQEVIVEEFIDFDYEITLLTVTQKNAKTLFCPPIGHRQEKGDYRESWQPCVMNPEHLAEAQKMAADITGELGGAGLWGVEFFVSLKNGVFFSELSPRPHDTGMVTLAGTQNLNEFELHCRAFLGYPIPEITSLNSGVSVAILYQNNAEFVPEISGIEDVLSYARYDVRIFGKPFTRLNRRMGVLLATADLSYPIESLKEKAIELSQKIKINPIHNTNE
jgi:phosphoribosylglycinamide formyltransferase 2